MKCRFGYNITHSYEAFIWVYPLNDNFRRSSREPKFYARDEPKIINCFPTWKIHELGNTARLGLRYLL